MTQRQLALAARNKQPHQRAVGRFAQGVETDSAPGGLYRPLEIAQRLIARGERVQHSQSHFAETGAFEIEPFLKRHLGNLKTIEKIAPIERGSGLQIGGIIGLRQAFEFKRVHRHMRTEQGNRFAAAFKRHLLGLAQSFFKRRQGLAQAAACLFLAALAPEQVHQPGARHGIIRRKREIGQNCLRFSLAELKRSARRETHLEAAQHIDLQRNHAPHRPF